MNKLRKVYRPVTLTLSREQILCGLRPRCPQYVLSKSDRAGLKRVQQKLNVALIELELNASKEATVTLTSLEAFSLLSNTVNWLGWGSPELRHLRDVLAVGLWKLVNSDHCDYWRSYFMNTYSSVRDYEYCEGRNPFRTLRDYSTEEIFCELRRRGGVTKNLATEEMLDELRNRGVTAPREVTNEP